MTCLKHGHFLLYCQKSFLSFSSFCAVLATRISLNRLTYSSRPFLKLNQLSLVSFIIPYYVFLAIQFFILICISLIRGLIIVIEHTSCKLEIFLLSVFAYVYLLCPKVGILFRERINHDKSAVLHQIIRICHRNGHSITIGTKLDLLSKKIVRTTFTIHNLSLHYDLRQYLNSFTLMDLNLYQ